MEKICTKCKVVKPFEKFNKDKYRKDGLTASCKECVSLNWKKFKEDHAEKLQEIKDNFNATRRQERLENPEKVRKEARDLYQKTKEKRRLYDKAYREKYLEQIKLRRKLQRIRDKLKLSQRHKLWRSKNIESIRERVRANAGKYAAMSAKRRASKLQATPKWLSPEQLDEIKLLYLFVAERRQITGLDLEVDHIVPLQGETVCGLHVPWNLQVLTASENASKGNRFHHQLS
jgi:5-methylcytosine-specific restriction endonuclease McrA